MFSSAAPMWPRDHCGFLTLATVGRKLSETPVAQVTDRYRSATLKDRLCGSYWTGRYLSVPQVSRSCSSATLEIRYTEVIRHVGARCHESLQQRDTKNVPVRKLSNRSVPQVSHSCSSTALEVGCAGVDRHVHSASHGPLQQCDTEDMLVRNLSDRSVPQVSHGCSGAAFETRGA